MDARCARAQQLGALPGSVLDADLLRSLLVFADPLELGAERRRYLVAGERRDALDLRYVGDRHDAGHERHADPRLAGALDEGEVVPVVVEELRDHDVEPGVDLRLQMADAEAEIATLGMALGVAAADQAQRPAAPAHEAD